eukprot:GHVS01088512.1.p1 GENE.GHVS01088512.1~~GHVS01088512.1.p1  ORF type:complete len:121 (+),score=18.41 GHVS01088512.1:215-577(+)
MSFKKETFTNVCPVIYGHISSAIAVVNREQRVVKMWDAQRGGRPIGSQTISATDVEYLCDELIFVGAEQEDLTAANSPQHFDTLQQQRLQVMTVGFFVGSTAPFRCLRRWPTVLHHRPTV